MKKNQMETREMLDGMLSLLDQHKAADPEVLKPDNAFADYIVVVTATSRRHAQGLADAIGELCHARGYEMLGLEGYDNGEWILADCNYIIINIFLEETRALYKLDELWTRAARKEKN